jgi:hypothetical protein
MFTGHAIAIYQVWNFFSGLKMVQDYLQFPAHFKTHLTLLRQQTLGFHNMGSITEKHSF